MTKILSILIYFLVRLLHSTYRYRYAGNEKLQKLHQKNQNFIFGIWHQNLFPGILAQTGYPHIVIVSKSKDAQPVAYTCESLGHFVVRGSSKKAGVDKGGAIAKDEMIEHLQAGHPGAVTVDGPKGPALKVKPGIIDMAKKSQAVLVPYTVSSNSYWQFKSWDQFRLPKPFAKLLVDYGDPLSVPADCTDFQMYQDKLEVSLNELTIHSQQCLLKWDDFSSKNWWYKKA
jgi:lysophospholipid acyltransferase (LPLAT)-like uncharacterized protein